MSAPTDPVQYEPDTPYPGEQLPLLEAMKVINRFRAKYHRGIAEKHEIFSERILQRFNDGRPPAFTTPEEVPEDIAKARLTRFGSLLPQVHLTGGGWF